MNREHLLSLAQRLKTIAIELENEVLGDVGSYTMSDDDYMEILDHSLDEYGSSKGEDD